jgi:hypothetical protein
MHAAVSEAPKNAVKGLDVVPRKHRLDADNFTGKVFQEPRRALRRIGMLSAMGAAAQTVARWLGRGYFGQ